MKAAARPAVQPGKPQKTPQTPSTPTPPTGAPPKKRPGETGAAPPAKKPTTDKLLVNVYSKATSDEIGIETLVGEYLEMGVNHGRKFFKRKKAPDGVEDVAVYLYYWDNRDGADFSGWWFGDKVGGSQVWSRVEKADTLPPKSGWRIPWDGDVQNDLVVDASAKTGAPGGTPGKPAKADVEEVVEEEDDSEIVAEVAERTQQATDRVVIAEIEATQALESAAAMLEGEVTEDELKVVEELLQAQQAALTEAHKKLAADVMAARKEAPKAVAALTKLTPRLRTVQASVVQEMQKAKDLFTKKKQEIMDSKKRARQEEQQLAAEQRDAKALEAGLPLAMDVVTQAEEALEAVIAAANPLNEDGAEAMNESVKKAIKDTEDAAGKAQVQIQEARKQLSQKITEARKFAPEAQKVALAEYSALQEKLAEMQKKLAPFSRIRKEFQQKIEAKKVMNEVANKLGSAEIEVDKVTSSLATNASEEDIKKAEAVITPVISALANAMKFVDQRVATATGLLKNDLVQMQERGQESKKKLDSFRSKLKTQLDQFQLTTVLQQGLDKTQSAEKAMEATLSAETPFLKGLDLPVDEAVPVIAACEESAKVAEVAASQAKNFMKAKLVDINRFPEETRKDTSAELMQLQNRAEAVAQKVAVFKRDTAQRKTNMLLQEVGGKVQDAEAKVEATVKAAEPLTPEKFDDAEIEELKSATEKVLELEKAAALAVVDARKAISAKQKEPQAQESPSFAAELKKLGDRITAAQTKLTAQRKLALQGEKTWKSRLLLKTKEAELSTLDKEIERVEIMTTPLGDERPSDEAIREMSIAVTNAQKSLTETAKALDQAQQGAQGPLKSSLVKLLAQTKKSQEKLDEIKATTQEQRERVQSEAILTEARVRLDKVDETFQKVSEAEAPYLKGLDLLPLEEGGPAVAACEAAIVAVQQCISDARAFLTTKTLEIRTCVASVSKAGLQEVATINQRLESQVEKLTQFKQDTQGRKRIAQTQEAQAKVVIAEEAVQKCILATAPLAAQNVDEMSPEEAADTMDKLTESEHLAQTKLDEARKFVSDRQREGRGNSGDLEDLTKLLGRLNSCAIDIAKAKSTASEHEQKFVARLILEEVNKQMDVLQVLVKKANDEAAPLIEDGGKSFVLASMTKMIMEALGDHGSKNDLSKDALFDLTQPKDGKVAEVQFTAFLEKVPELCSRPDLAFNPEQRVALFEHLDSASTGSITKEKFMDSFRERFVCVQGISITEGFEISTSQTLGKLEVGDVIEAIGDPKTHDSLGIIRLQVKQVKDGSTGWVTIQGNQGTMYFEPFTAFGSFYQNITKVIATAQSTASKTSKTIQEKGSELRDAKQGPLFDAKAELAKRRPEISVMQSKLETLKKKIEDGKREHAKREEFERKKAVEKKDRQAAAIILKMISDKIDKAKASVEKMEAAAAPLVGGEVDPTTSKTPLAVKKAVADAGDLVTASVTEAFETLKAHVAKVVKASKGPWAEAGEEMKKFQLSLRGMQKKVDTTKESIQSACELVADAKIGQVSSALRTAVQTRKVTIEKLYQEIAGGNEEQIAEEKFMTYISKVEGFSATEEQKQLMLEKLGSGGVRRRSFFQMIERYCICVKDIAITVDFDIKSSETVRKMEIGEIVEVLDGPKTDEDGAMTRVRGRALVDNKEGWITLRGNQGTPFLQDSAKPCYYAAEELSLQDGFVSEGSTELRTLTKFEVIEVLEGPRKEALGNTVRAKVKACSDGAVGWFTKANKIGDSFAEPGKSNYTIVSAIALTDAMDIKDCKVIRKLDRGEVLAVLEGPIEDGNSGVQRIRVSAAKDKAEGWVTVKGNAGSVYCEETGKNFNVTKEVALQKSFASDSAETVRTLAVGEALELLEEPREEKTEAITRVKGRAISDGKIGWLSMKGKCLRPWSPQYKCVNTIAMQDALDVGTANTVRKIDSGETLELLDGPTLDKEVGVMRIRCRADRDGATGWMTISGNQGKAYLEVVV